MIDPPNAFANLLAVIGMIAVFTTLVNLLVLRRSAQPRMLYNWYQIILFVGLAEIVYALVAVTCTLQLRLASAVLGLFAATIAIVSRRRLRKILS